MPIIVRCIQASSAIHACYGWGALELGVFIYHFPVIDRHFKGEIAATTITLDCKLSFTLIINVL